jgi:S-(hydroxymethyl)mycothiol dehydrogenase
MPRMSHDVRAVVSRSKGEPVGIETIRVPDPGPGEAVVAVQACGVCHTDLHYREGSITDAFPFLLGHEAAGTVEAVGPDVTDVAPGDFVILNWRAVCGQCRACRRGRPWYCFATHTATQQPTLLDGTPLTPALGIGAFAEKTLVAAGQCTPVDPAAPPEVAGLLGCGVMAGIGAAINTGQVGRGGTVAVIGCGATHTVNSSHTNPVRAIRDATGGFGADVVIDAVGNPETYRQAFAPRDLAGTVVLVGVPTPDMELSPTTTTTAPAAHSRPHRATSTARTPARPNALVVFTSCRCHAEPKRCCRRDGRCIGSGARADRMRGQVVTIVRVN